MQETTKSSDCIQLIYSDTLSCPDETAPHVLMLDVSVSPEHECSGYAYV